MQRFVRKEQPINECSHHCLDRTPRSTSASNGAQELVRYDLPHTSLHYEMNKECDQCANKLIKRH